MTRFPKRFNRLDIRRGLPMIKFLIFCLVSFLAHGEVNEEASEKVIFKKLIPTSFGIKSRTIDKKDAESVIKEIEQFKLSNPTAEISIDVLTCTSDYELPPVSLTDKKIDEHLQLGLERSLMIKNELIKLSIPFVIDTKICGPVFKKDDLNDRFVTKESKTFATKFEALKKTEGFLDQLREEALIEDPETLMELHSTLFLAKFKPFQGIRLLIKGKVKQATKVEKLKVQPSSKTQ